MHDKDITLYNRVKGANYERDTYHATVLHNVSVKHVFGAETGTDGDRNMDTVHLSICEEYLQDKEYKKPKAYLGLVDKTNVFTLQKGDFFVIGVVEEETDVDDLLSYMKEKYDDVHEILSVGTFNLIPHWEVVAR
ncbi:MAG: hypothetical protein E7290_12520 [Lachnospiraceae bacterium]|nr:hypothetical protein [Lachnospiraceae bacterium]